MAERPDKAMAGARYPESAQLWWGWIRVALWLSLVVILTVAIVVGGSLDRCDTDGNLIAFRSYRSGLDSLYAVDADSGTLCRLSRASAGGSIGSNHVTWSPAGDTLAWIDDNQLFIQRVGAPYPTALTSRVTGYEWPLAWSPDGTRIAFVTFRSDGVLTLAVITTTSPPALRPLAVVEQPMIDPNGSPPSSQLAGSRLTWSPDGRTLLLDIGQQIVELDVDDTASHVRLARGRQPAWSPDGAWIAFTRDEALVVTAAGGKGERVLSRRGQAPVWSPDSTWIAFLSDSGVAVVRPDGSAERLVFSGSVTPISDSNASSYAWSPDSQRLAVLAYELRGATSVQPIIIVTLADGQQRRLVDRGHNGSLAWRPDEWRAAAATATDSRRQGGRP